MESNSQIEVTIAGNQYTLTTEKDEAYIRELVEYVDQKLAEIDAFRGSSYMSPHLRTILVAINMADDLFSERRAPHLPDQEAEEFTKRVRELKSENVSLRQKNDALALQSRKAQAEAARSQEELALAKKELQDYVEAFGDPE